MKTLNINTWNRKEHFNHFNGFTDPYFDVIIPFDVTKAYQFSKENGISFFSKYLHDCMKAINSIENFKYRIENDEVVVYDVIHASATIMRSDKSFGFSFIHYNDNLNIFIENVNKEKERIEKTTDLFPPQNTIDCIYCSAMPWLNFSGHKEPVSGNKVSVPMLAYSKVEEQNGKLMMNVSISANHALVDGYHVGLFSEAFQNNLNSINNK